VGGRHLVSVHDIGQNERQQPYLVLELADRGSLRARIESLRTAGWRASREDVLAVARPLAAAVAAVHEAQLVHRDLSPGNLLLAGTSGEAARAVGIEASPSAVVRDDERLLVADLGMCKDLALSSGLTVAAGTDGFRPPEQSRPAVVDIRADIWAMSALVDWLVQGAETSPELEEVLARGLSEDPDARQAEATEWLAELEEALAPPPATARDDPAPGPVPHGPVADDASDTTDGSAAPSTAEVVTPRSPRRRALLAALPVLTLGVGLGAGALLGLDSATPSAAGDSAISIAGPEEIRVGEEAVFTAEVEGVDSWVWTLPTGAHLVDAEQIPLTASGPGRAEVVLRARASDGQELEARHLVRVRE
jgi:hypothetical protein